MPVLKWKRRKGDPQVSLSRQTHKKAERTEAFRLSTTDRKGRKYLIHYGVTTSDPFWGKYRRVVCRLTCDGEQIHYADGRTWTDKPIKESKALVESVLTGAKAVAGWASRVGVKKYLAEVSAVEAEARVEKEAKMRKEEKAAKWERLRKEEVAAKIVAQSPVLCICKEMIRHYWPGQKLGPKATRFALSICPKCKTEFWAKMDRKLVSPLKPPKARSPKLRPRRHVDDYAPAKLRKLTWKSVKKWAERCRDHFEEGGELLTVDCLADLAHLETARGKDDPGWLYRAVKAEKMVRAVYAKELKAISLRNDALIRESIKDAEKERIEKANRKHKEMIAMQKVQEGVRVANAVPADLFRSVGKIARLAKVSEEVAKRLLKSLVEQGRVKKSGSGKYRLATKVSEKPANRGDKVAKKSPGKKSRTKK